MVNRGPDDEGYLAIQQDQCKALAGSDTIKSDNLEWPYLKTEDIALHKGKPTSLAFGFRRLSILDLSVNGHQPMSDKEGKCWVIFNGEIYNFKDLRKLLPKRNFKNIFNYKILYVFIIFFLLKTMS